MSVAILAVGGLIYLIAMHHRRDGGLLSQNQEETILIVGFGLFWMAVLLGWQALKAGSSTEVPIRGLEGVPAGTQGVRRERPVGLPRPVRPYPCSYDDAYCVVEEYTFG
ncbi:hypothetical protein FB45DRAFT_903963 [Roridomyces roridus]|uniref:Uncharacterized protein n=1 Tax=Roridomyces roridus TaxID=1738132 RepID=A0AAD7C4R6_9AGAR|nr:hypothetical protein FB45DRAFT_903963 [Roridomyces roridus]